MVSGFVVPPELLRWSPNESSSHLNLLQVQVKLADCLEKAGFKPGGNWEGFFFSKQRHPNTSEFFMFYFFFRVRQDLEGLPKQCFFCLTINTGVRSCFFWLVGESYKIK